MDGDIHRPGGFGGITKFFISKLSEGCTHWELKCGLVGLGEVTGTYVAKKWIKKLERSLKGLRLGGCKRYVNIAKFAMENGSSGNLKESNVPKPRKSDYGANKSFNIRDSRSYSDVLGKGKMEGSDKESGSSLPASGLVGWKTIMIPDGVAAFRELWGKAVVGRTVYLETLVDLDCLLRIAKVVYANIQYLGGLSTLIYFCDEAAASKFLDSSGLWGPWFSKLAAWEGQSILFERDVERIKEFVMVKWKNRNFRIWVEEELDIWVPHCLEGVGGSSPAISAPTASSPVGGPTEPGNQGEFYVEDEELCMGDGLIREVDPVRSLSSNGVAGVVPNEVSFNWQPFLDSCSGNVPNPPGKEKVGIHFFKASKKAKRFRKGGPNCQHVVNGGSPNFVMDSSKKCRPKKRNRVHVEDTSDPFSLDNLFESMKKKGDGGGSVHPPVSAVNLNQPLNSDGVPVEADVGVN
ncbi:hypothetical protein Hanom_Chr16g01479011 [Helianthus anomalus]